MKVTLTRHNVQYDQNFIVFIGNWETCTRHAISKAICDGSYYQVFCHEQVDFDQDKVTDALIALDPNLEDKGKWPTRYHKTIFTFTDETTKKLWDLKLFVTKIDEMDQFRRERTVDNPVFTHVLVYGDMDRCHCIYVKEVWFRKHWFAECINSIPTDPEPSIRLDKPNNMFYRIWCNLKERRAEKVQRMPLLYGLSFINGLIEKVQNISLSLRVPPIETREKLFTVITNLKALSH